MPDQPAAAPEIQKAPFIHLHAHSMYSLLDALGDPSDFVAKAKELGYDAIALTDHASLYGVIEFYEAAAKAGIKPIIGVEAYLAPNKLTDKRPRIDDHVSHLTILAETDEGYRNLLKLVSISYLDGFYYKPRMDKDILREMHGGLIALSGCMKGEIPKACQAHDEEKAEQLIREYVEIFGADSFFLELVHHPESATQNDINFRLVNLSKKTGVPLVATKDSHYLSPEYADAQDALQCIHDGKLIADINRYNISDIDHSLVAPDVMVEAFKDTPEAIENTRRIADRCNVKIELGKNHLPVFEVPEGETPDTQLRKLCLEGMLERYPAGATPEALERLDFELQTIERMGFASYFLIVHDYVKWAKDNGVIVGPGRGSAAGSIVAYALGITNLDPLAYGLLFERFLNPDRISMPDIDMDFDDVQRKDVIEYVTRKYGRDRVAGIITFGTMAARAAVRDVGRVLGLTFQEVDQVAKVIPPPVQGRHIPLEKSVVEVPELKAMYESDQRVHELIDLAIKLEGTARHASQHACGIVIAPAPLVEFTPLQKAQGGDVEQVVQYSLHPVEVVGLLKMDFLGLSNLTVIRECLEIMEAVHGVSVDIDKLKLDDPLTYDLLGKGETTGVFQLESDGMKRYIRELKPSVIEDIIAMVALYRPGPMQFIDSFIARKHGKEKITYMHPLLENALGNTYGIPVYQEQVMQVSKDMAGFTGGQADTLRKAMGKKIAKLMAEMREKFIQGSVANGVEKSIAEAIFQQFEEFAAYGFNKSHAACYALIAYQTAYLKAHWPECFMAALMNSDSANLDRITIEVEECRRMGLKVLPPDLNESFAGFSVVKSSVNKEYAVQVGEEFGTPTIRFGLVAIKGLGTDVVESIVRERKAGGKFKDLASFLSRVKGKVVNRKSLESLIRSGALDRFGDRNQLLFNIESLLEFHRNQEKEEASGQVNLFSSALSAAPAATLQLRPAPPADQRELLMWEKELLGLYVSGHPFKAYAERLAGLAWPIRDLRQRLKDKSVRIAGVVTQAKKIRTKNNENMVFAEIEDLTGKCEAIVFPRTLQETAACWDVDRILVVTGRPQDKDGSLKVLAETAYQVTPDNIDEIVGHRGSGTGAKEADAGQDPGFFPGKTGEPESAPSNGPADSQALTLHVRATLPETVILRLRRIFDEKRGPYPVYFLIDDVDGQRRIKSSAKIGWSEEIVREIEGILGPGTVKIG
jgi:DNA polymerase-3 subunit alpha